MPPPTWWLEALCLQSVHASVCVSVCACVSPKQTLLARYLEYLLMEFVQTFTSNGLWGKDEHVKFWGPKGQGYGGIKYAPKCTLQLSHVGRGIIVNRVVTTI